jgi:hypothetical protein
MSNLSNNLGQEYANFDILHMMKTDIEAGKSFTESMKSFGGMTYDDTHFGDMEDNEITRLGPRAAYGTPHVDHWERMGGRFSAQEQEHLNNTPEQTPPEPPSPEEREILGRPIHEVEPEEVDRFASQSHEEREATLKGIADDMDAASRAAKVEMKPVSKHVSDFLPAPSEVAKGAVAGYLAEKAVTAVDPDRKLDKIIPDGDTLATGVGAAQFAAGLGGRLATAPEMLAGAVGIEGGSKIQQGTDYLLKKAGVNKDVADGTSSAVGGGSGALLGIGTMAATGALDLSELGPLGIAAGAAGGAVLGVGGWLMHKFHWFGM